MLIPNEIFIGGHSIEIKKVGSDILKNPGHFDSWYHLIKINIDDAKEDIQAEALLHEIIEAVSTIYNLGLDHKDLTVLSEVLFAIIRNNKLNFLQGGGI